MGWNDNRNKSQKEMAQEEKLAELRAQIRKMESKVAGYNVIQIKIQPRLRRNGVFVDAKSFNMTPCESWTMLGPIVKK